jgi:hypothetical protein
MIIDISKHYFSYYAGTSKLNELNGFKVGEIINDGQGYTGVILGIYDKFEVRTDSNGMVDASKIKKLRSKDKIKAYLFDLHRADIDFINREFEELEEKL